jgi:hypothetical protein
MGSKRNKLSRNSLPNSLPDMWHKRIMFSEVKVFPKSFLEYVSSELEPHVAVFGTIGAAEVWVLCYDRRSVGQSVLDWSTHLGLGPDFYYCQTVAGLLMWGPDKRTGLSFTVAAGPCQRSHSQVRVPWDSWPYFTLLDSRLPFSSPLTTHRATMEVFDPASTVDASWNPRGRGPVIPRPLRSVRGYAKRREEGRVEKLRANNGK